MVSSPSNVDKSEKTYDSFRELRSQQQVAAARCLQTRMGDRGARLQNRICNDRWVEHCQKIHRAKLALDLSKLRAGAISAPELRAIFDEATHLNEGVAFTPTLGDLPDGDRPTAVASSTFEIRAFS